MEKELQEYNEALRGLQEVRKELTGLREQMEAANLAMQGAADAIKEYLGV